MLNVSLLLFVTLLPGAAFAHDPDTEADEIFRARTIDLLEQYLARFSEVRDGPSALVTGPISHPGRFISGITTPPPPMRVALTFDDGPDAEAAPYILDVLAKYRVHAAFFMKGNEAEAHPDLVRRIAADGHLIIGNHSWSHPDFHTIPPAQQAEEVRRNFELLGQYQNPKLFRYPYGNSTPETNDLVHSMGYEIVGWHVDSCDWAYNKTGSVDEARAKICGVAPEDRDNFQGHVVHALLDRRGGILLMHEIQPNTIRQLDQIMAKLVREGFSFGTLDEADFRPSFY